MNVISSFIILLALTGCINNIIPTTPSNSGGDKYKFHVVEDNKKTHYKLFSTKINSDDVIIFGRINENISFLKCFVSTELPLVSYYGKLGMYSVNKKPLVLNKKITNLYPHSEPQGIIALHIPKDKLDGNKIKMNVDCPFQDKLITSYSTYGTYTSASHDYYPLPDINIVNNEAFESGSLYYFGDLFYEVKTFGKLNRLKLIVDKNGTYELKNNFYKTYNDLLKLLPSLKALSPKANQLDLLQ